MRLPVVLATAFILAGCALLYRKICVLSSHYVHFVPNNGDGGAKAFTAVTDKAKEAIGAV